MLCLWWLFLLCSWLSHSWRLFLCVSKAQKPTKNYNFWQFLLFFGEINEGKKKKKKRSQKITVTVERTNWSRKMVRRQFVGIRIATTDRVPENRRLMEKIDSALKKSCDFHAEKMFKDPTFLHAHWSFSSSQFFKLNLQEEEGVRSAADGCRKNVG